MKRLLEVWPLLLLSAVFCGGTVLAAHALAAMLFGPAAAVLWTAGTGVAAGVVWIATWTAAYRLTDPVRPAKTGLKGTKHGRRQ